MSHLIVSKAQDIFVMFVDIGFLLDQGIVLDSVPTFIGSDITEMPSKDLRVVRVPPGCAVWVPYGMYPIVCIYRDPKNQPQAEKKNPNDIDYFLSIPVPLESLARKASSTARAARLNHHMEGLASKSGALWQPLRQMLKCFSEAVSDASAPAV